MSRKRYAHELVRFTMILGAVLLARAQTNQNVPRLSLGTLELRNVKAEAVNYKGRAAIRLIDTGAPDLGDAGRLAIVRGSSFTDGTIEVDVTGDTAPDAAENLRGFVGIAFRVAAKGSSFECFTFDPRTDDLRTNCSGIKCATSAREHRQPFFCRVFRPLKGDVTFRKKVAEQVGIGFEVPFEKVEVAPNCTQSELRVRN